MKKLKIYCTSIKHLNILDKLPFYIKPLGLGPNKFPHNWSVETQGENISILNKFYGELSGFYWMWKNGIKDLKKDDLIGFCHYRKLWLNDIFLKKQKYSTQSLYSNLLDDKNTILEKNEVIQIQPIYLKKRNLFEEFYDVHKNDSLKQSVNFLDKKYRIKFQEHLEGNELFGLNMFISSKYIFEEYCNILFPWMESCNKYCKDNNLLEGYNIRLPAFLAERFTSFWFSQYKNKACLSYAKLGKLFLSNNVNKIINPIKIPFTFRMYPTTHRYLEF